MLVDDSTPGSMVSFLHINKSRNREKKSGTELGKAQLQLELDFTLLHYIDDNQLTSITYPELNKPVNLVTCSYLHTSLLNCMLACLLTFLYTCLQRQPNCPLLTVNSNRPKSHPSHPLNFH